MNFNDIYCGMVLRDNDPRYEGRTVTVTCVGTGPNDKDLGAYYHTGRREQFIKANRIYDDGKERHQGWSLVKGPEDISFEPGTINYDNKTEALDPVYDKNQQWPGQMDANGKPRGDF